ncbi:uncharacterized protein PB18E9.04c-like [Gambusia affinis]|uniref:uncharacterized protein PB18E9.04c-like n=1 Tax=Gambusia affinis TaxID=33528 RepID=UPI001CDBDF96|nr:uncharacterized protein PB18E9.04c-like [Gambusia affinis]
MSDFESDAPPNSPVASSEAPGPSTMFPARRSVRIASRSVPSSPASILCSRGISLTPGLRPYQVASLAALLPPGDISPSPTPPTSPPLPPTSGKRSRKSSAPPAKRRRGRPPSSQPAPRSPENPEFSAPDPSTHSADPTPEAPGTSSGFYHSSSTPPDQTHVLASTLASSMDSLQRSISSLSALLRSDTPESNTPSRIPIFPVRINTVVAFLTHCFVNSGCKHSYIRSLLAGINFFNQLHQPTPSISLFSSPVIKLLLKGFASQRPALPDDRKPITLPILRDLLVTISSSPYSPYLKSLLSSSFLLAFYGLLRLGEFTTPNNLYVPSRDLAFSDLKFHPDYYSLDLKHSKAKGACTIFVARINGPFCPFLAMFKFALLRRKVSFPSEALFLTPEGNPMSTTWFLKHLRLLLAAINLPHKQFSGHSFRIGAATSAAAQGISSTSLQQLGRWSSSAYSSYIRPDLSSVLSVQRSLSA